MPVPRPPPPAATPRRPPAPPTPEPLAAPRSGEFKGTDDFHFGRGTATLLETAPGEWTIRLEDFSVRNGPDLFVYLSPDPEDYADGAHRGREAQGDRRQLQRPRFPPALDPSGQESVLIWCKQFSHLFAVATLEG